MDDPQPAVEPPPSPPHPQAAVENGSNGTAGDDNDAAPVVAGFKAIQEQDNNASNVELSSTWNTTTTDKTEEEESMDTTTTEESSEVPKQDPEPDDKVPSSPSSPVKENVPEEPPSDGGHDLFDLVASGEKPSPVKKKAAASDDIFATGSDKAEVSMSNITQNVIDNDNR